MSRDLTFAELIAANRAYRVALSELVALARDLLGRRTPRPAQGDIIDRAEAALERFQ